jgi:hypothetical protein
MYCQQMVRAGVPSIVSTSSEYMYDEETWANLFYSIFLDLSYCIRFFKLREFSISDSSEY